MICRFLYDQEIVHPDMWVVDKTSGMPCPVRTQARIRQERDRVELGEIDPLEFQKRTKAIANKGQTFSHRLAGLLCLLGVAEPVDAACKDAVGAANLDRVQEAQQATALAQLAVDGDPGLVVVEAGKIKPARELNADTETAHKADQIRKSRADRAA